MEANCTSDNMGNTAMNSEHQADVCCTVGENPGDGFRFYVQEKAVQMTGQKRRSKQIPMRVLYLPI